MVGLHLERLACRYRLAPEIADEDGLRRRLDGLAGGEMPRALERMLPETLAAAGVGGEAAIAIRTVRARLRLRGASIAGEHLAEAWAGALLGSLRAALDERANAARRQDVAVFEDRRAAERAWLRTIARGEPEPWWCGLLLAAGGRLPRPAELVHRWIEETPAEVPGRLADLLHATGVGATFRWLDDAEAERLLGHLRERHRSRLGALDVEQAPHGGAPSPEALRRRFGLWAAALAPSRHLLAGIEAPAVRRLLATAVLLARVPGAGMPDDETVERLLAMPPGRSAWQQADSEAGQDTVRSPDGETAAAGPAGDDPTAFPPGDAVSAPSPAGAQRPDRPAAPAAAALGDAEAAEPATTPLDERDRHAVGFGGLLFLIRPLLRSWSGCVPAEADHCEARLAFALLSIERILARLPADRRRALLSCERPLVEVFCGRSALPEDPAAWLDDERAWEIAGAALDECLRRVPPTVAAHESSVHQTFGPDQLLCPSGGADGRLAALLVRRGHLEIAVGRVDLHLPADAVDIAIRRAGLDIDPGWVPQLGRVVRFHYHPDP